MGVSSQSHGLRELKSPRDPEAKALTTCVASPAQLLVTEGFCIWSVSPALPFLFVREMKP